MKFGYFLIAILVLPAVTSADVHFELPASGYKFDAASGAYAYDLATKLTRFQFEGHATAVSKELDFRSETLRGMLFTPKGSKKPVIKHAETAGSGTVTRTVLNDKGTSTTTVTGSRLVFDGDATRGNLKISGPVDILSSGSDKSNLHLTGKTGTVEFDMSKSQAQDALRTAVLDQSVTIDMAQVNKGEGRIHATGDHLVYDNVSSPPTLILTGKIAWKGDTDNANGSATGVHKVKFILNRRGELTSLEMGDVQK